MEKQLIYYFEHIFKIEDFISMCIIFENTFSKNIVSIGLSLMSCLEELQHMIYLFLYHMIHTNQLFTSMWLNSTNHYGLNLYNKFNFYKNFLRNKFM